MVCDNKPWHIESVMNYLIMDCWLYDSWEMRQLFHSDLEDVQ